MPAAYPWSAFNYARPPLPRGKQPRAPYEMSRAITRMRPGPCRAALLSRTLSPFAGITRIALSRRRRSRIPIFIPEGSANDSAKGATALFGRESP